MYIDGYSYAVPKAAKEDFIHYALTTAGIFKKHGAIRVVEAWGDHIDVPENHASFAAAVKCNEDEQVMFSWCEWPDKAARDTAMEPIIKEMEALGITDMPFDGKRMIYGSFIPVVEA